METPALRPSLYYMQLQGHIRRGDLGNALATREQLVNDGTVRNALGEDNHRALVLACDGAIRAAQVAKQQDLGDAANFYERAATDCVPEVCAYRSGVGVHDQCVVCFSQLNTADAAVCEVRALLLSEAWKFRGNHHVAREELDQALDCRQRAFESVSWLRSIRPTRMLNLHVAYLQDWLCLTKGYMCAFQSHLREARRAFRDAATASANFSDDSKLFPNYFGTFLELQLHGHVLDGIRRVKRGEYSLAKVEFTTWLRCMPDDSSHRRHDVLGYALACQAAMSSKDWQGAQSTAREYLQTRSLSAPTRELLHKLVSSRGNVQFAEDLRSAWRLFIDAAPLDERSGTGPRFWPRFLSEPANLGERDEAAEWLCHQVTCAAWLFLDYKDSEAALPIHLKDLDAAALAQGLETKRIREHLSSAPDLSTLSYRYAKFVGGFNWPHLVQVVESTPTGDRSQITVRRQMNANDELLVLEQSESLNAGTYGFLRPRYNLRRHNRYRMSGEVIRPSRALPWLARCHEEWSQSGPRGTRFRQWLLQFSDSERQWAMRLFSGIDYFDTGRQRAGWREIWRSLPTSVQQGAVFVGLGHGAKSGRMMPYILRQGLCTEPEYGMYSGRERNHFRDISEFGREAFADISAFCSASGKDWTNLSGVTSVRRNDSAVTGSTRTTTGLSPTRARCGVTRAKPLASRHGLVSLEGTYSLIPADVMATIATEMHWGGRTVRH